jgi:DNA modification methylase
VKRILEYFASLKVDESWTYADLTPKEITYLTHSYHRYPAKFIPQLANRLIRMYTERGEVVLDPFVGSGTTIVEGLLLGRPVIGIDVNPVSYLICKAKTINVNPDFLEKNVEITLKKIRDQSKNDQSFEDVVEDNRNYARIKYWFDQEAISDLSLILRTIEEIENEDISIFLKCGFSHILKNCSKWQMYSIKPHKKQGKKIPPAVPTFTRQVHHMVNKYRLFYNALPENIKRNIKRYARVLKRDCRDVPLSCEDFHLILTSPPYVTSYEYADIHQLTLIWLEPEIPYTEHKKKFIGTSIRKEKPNVNLYSEIGKEIVEELKAKDSKHARAVFTYFAEMQQAMAKFRERLKPGGKACFVIGNTRLARVNILNAEVLTETCLNMEYNLETVIKRRIAVSAKFLPSARDPKTGRFVSLEKKNKQIVYPNEYIIVLSNPA